MVDRDTVIEANRVVHATMANAYGAEPHWKQENQKKVLARFTKLLPENRENVLDLGAGSGFLTLMLAPYFENVYALDVTQEMLDLMPLRKNIKKILGNAEKTDFPDETFDMVTCYSFLHHLFDPESVIKEAFRILKPKGVLYFDLEPNRDYWRLMDMVHKNKEFDKNNDKKGFTQQEVDKTLFIDKIVEKEFGIPAETFYLAEYTKGRTDGISVDKLKEILSQIGFTKINIVRDWYLGQAIALHEYSEEFSEKLDTFLRDLGPVSDFMFKYFYGSASKPKKI